MTYPWDTTAPSFPAAEALTLAGLLRGGELHTVEHVRCAAAVIDYGLATLVGTAAIPEVAVITRDHAALHLESGVWKPGVPRAVDPKALPWGPILHVVLTLLQAWLASHGG